MKSYSKCLLYLLLLCITSCFSNDRTQLNEENPFYIRGLQLQEEGEYRNAVETFLQCLRVSPGSYKAHLQLAIIFEDSLDDLPRAIVHYNTFLKSIPSDDPHLYAENWLHRAENRYYLLLRTKFEIIDNHDSQNLRLGEVVKNEGNEQTADNTHNALSQPGIYVVKEGDSLNRIAKITLGDSQKWTLLFELNKDVLSSPEQLSIGQELRIPRE